MLRNSRWNLKFEEFAHLESFRAFLNWNETITNKLTSRKVDDKMGAVHGGLIIVGLVSY